MTSTNHFEYRIIKHLGSGAGHSVSKVQHLKTDKFYAMKIEKNIELGQLKEEIQKLTELSGIVGVPQIIDFGKTKEFKSYLVTQILTKNLYQLTKEASLSISCVLALGLGVLEILEQVHNKNILHLDIKPENIMISKSSIDVQIEEIISPGFVQLIDFGLSQSSYKGKTQKKVFVGSLRYASRQAHKGQQLSYKDDLESLLYVLVYLRNFELPWQSIKPQRSQQQEIKVIGEMKDAVFKSSVLTSTFPSQFIEFKQYLDSLTVQQMPNYQFLKDLFKQMLQIDNYSLQNRLTASNSFSSRNSELRQEKIKQLFSKFPDDQLSLEEDFLEDDNSTILVSERITKYTNFTKKLINDIKY